MKLDIIVDSPNGVELLRNVLLSMATSGRLLRNRPDELPPDFDSSYESMQSPSNWLDCHLDDIAVYGGNGSVKSSEIPRSSWILDLEDIEPYSGRLLQRVELGSRPSSSNKTTFNKGDVLYGKLRPYLNKVIIANEEGYCSTEIVPISPKQGLLPEWLKLCLRRPQFLRYAGVKSYGMKMPRLGTKDAKFSRHPLPPLAEQKRIVAKVYELMALCDQLEEAQTKRDSIRTAARKSSIDAVATASTSQELDVAWKRISSNWGVMADTPESVEDLRRLILDLSVRGVLVPLDEADHSAEHLVAESLALAKRKKISHHDFNEPPLLTIPKHWTWSTVEGMCETQTGTTPKLRDSDGQIELIQYVTAADIKKQRAIENNFVPLGAAKRGGRIAPGNSVLFVGIGATIGKCCLLESQATFNQQIHAATPRNINARYLTLVMASSYFQQICRERTNATAIPILNKSKWESIHIPIPPLSDQAQIVEKTSELFVLCDELESQIGIREVVAEKFARSVTASESR